MFRRVTPGHVGDYFTRHPGSLLPYQEVAPGRDPRHATLLNPAALFRLERYQDIKGKTHAISVYQPRQLLASSGVKSGSGRR